MNNIVIPAAMSGLTTSRNVVASMTSLLKKFSGVLLICTPKAIIATPTKALANILSGAKKKRPCKSKGSRWQSSASGIAYTMGMWNTTFSASRGVNRPAPAW